MIFKATMLIDVFLIIIGKDVKQISILSYWNRLCLEHSHRNKFSTNALIKIRYSPQIISVYRPNRQLHCRLDRLFGR